MAAQTSASEDEEDDASAAPGAAPGAPPGYACQHCRALCPIPLSKLLQLGNVLRCDLRQRHLVLLP